jgi:hypothetical protein
MPPSIRRAEKPAKRSDQVATKSLYLNKVERNQEQGSKAFMKAAPFDFTPLLPAGLPAAAAKWTGLAKYSFVGGNNDPEQVPLDV